MTIGERLLKLRKERNISQEDLANVLDVSRQTVSKWETDQSQPDFDKIIPLCEYFGITSDELLTGNQNIKEAKKENFKSNFARNIAIAVMLYIFALISIIALAGGLDKPILGVSVFFGFIAVATGLLIYNGIYYSKESEEPKSKKDDSIEKQVMNIIDIVGVTIYLFVSFMTMAWHITWMIFLIVGLVKAIVKLIMSISSNKEKKDENE